MKLLRKTFFFLISLFLLFIVLSFAVRQYLKPTYNGELKIAGLQDTVTVFFDENGVPHITAQNQADAYRVFGYVHAQDRLWQMELMRRIAAGRLSEIFGEKLVRTDKLFSSLGIEEAAETAIENLDKDSMATLLTEAYLDGINQYISNGKTPIEFYLLGIDKEKFSKKDVYNVFGYMAFSFAAAHKIDPLLTEIQQKLGKPYLDELGIQAQHTTLIKSTKKAEIKAEFTNAVSQILEELPAPVLTGSNSWILGPEKTKKGKVIFANDPHIGISQPSVWYQNHIKTPNYEMYGFNIALMPFPLLGHNSNYAYGLTMLLNDDINFYVEEDVRNSSAYKTPEGHLSYQKVLKKIKVKDEKDSVYELRISKHGPIINDVLDQVNYDKPVAMQWTYTKLPNHLLQASYGMAHANSLEEFKEGVSKIHAPGLNVMYGDAKNNIAWFASAKLAKYRDSLNSKVFLDGASGKDDVLGYYNFEENPQAINPSWNYVCSSNNQPDSLDGKLYPGYYFPEDRAKKILSMIKPKNDFTRDDVKTMIHDVNSIVATEFLAEVVKHVHKNDLTESEKKALEILKNWDGTFLKEYTAPTIYNRFLYEFYKNTYADELGDKAFQVFLKTGPMLKKALGSQIGRENSVWWDDVNTLDHLEDKAWVLNKSFKETVGFLETQLGENIDEWQWKKVLSMEHPHAIGKAGGILRKFFNVGPYEIDGSDNVISKLGFLLDSSGVYKVKSIPSSRRVIDFSDVEQSLGIIPTGQSGNPFSAHYKDQTQKFLNKEMVIMKLNHKEIEKSKNKLVFRPE